MKKLKNYEFSSTKKLQNSQFDSTEWPFNVSDDFEDGMIPADMDTVQIDHDYGKSEVKIAISADKSHF